MGSKRSLALVIEDDRDIARLFACAVQEAGFVTEVAHCGESAMLWLLSFTPDVVVLDIHLPRVEGKDILGYIRGEDRLADTRVIVATADPAFADSFRNNEDVDLVLVKPISFDQLRDLSERICQEPPTAATRVSTFAGSLLP